MDKKSSSRDGDCQTYGFGISMRDSRDFLLQVGCVAAEVRNLVFTERSLILQILVGEDLSELITLDFAKTSIEGEFAGVGFQFNYFPHSPHLIHGIFKAKKQP